MRDEWNNQEDNNARLSPFMVTLAIIIGTTLVLGITMVIMNMMTTRTLNHMNIYQLGEAKTCGYIGIKITYDMEPVDIILYDPDGNEYTKDARSALYEVDEKNKAVSLLIDSDKLGQWSAKFNTKSNKKLDYCMMETPSDTPYMSTPYIHIGDDGQYYLTLTVSVSETEAEPETVQCSLTLSKTSFSYNLGIVDIPANEETDVLLNFPDHVFTDEDYRLQINICTKSNMSTRDEISVHLNDYDKKEKPSEDESSD